MSKIRNIQISDQMDKQQAKQKKQQIIHQIKHLLISDSPQVIKKILSFPKTRNKGFFSNSEWTGKNNGQDSSRLFIYFKQLRCKKINFYFCFNPIILKELSTPYFPKLKEIFLVNNDIKNLEDIQFVNAPNLQLLSLHRNNIVKIQALRKSNFSKLDDLTIGNNNIQILEKWPEILFKQKSQQIIIDYRQEYKNQQNDVSIFAKSNIQEAESIYFTGNTRIYQERVMKVQLHIYQSFRLNAGVLQKPNS